MEKKTTPRWFPVLSWIAAGLWMLCLFFFSSLDGKTLLPWLDGVNRLLTQILSAMIQPLPSSLSLLMDHYLPLLLQAGAYMVLAFLCWNALRASGLGPNAAPALGLAVATLFGVIDELHQMFVPGRAPRILDWAVGFAASFVLLLGIWLFVLCLRKLPKIVNRETVSYVVFGALTTLVNIVAYLLCKTALDSADAFGGVTRTLLSTTVAWVVAVLFAYVVNKLFVFRSKTSCAREALREFLLFIAARLFSYGVDALGMVLLVNVALLGDALSKLLMNIVVMIMNYFFSKWFIFNQGQKTGKKSSGES